MSESYHASAASGQPRYNGWREYFADPAAQVPRAHDHWARIHAASDGFAGSYRHVPGLGWRHWDGVIWAEGDREAFREHLDRVEGGRQALHLLDPPEQRKFSNAVEAAANVPFTESVLKAMSRMSLFHANASSFDADTSILVTPKGVVANATLQLMTHDAARLVMRCTRGSIDPDREDRTRWAQFMAEVFPEPATLAFMRRLLGYIAFGHRHEHLFPIFAGDGGNGKSVMVEVLAHALGDYACTAPVELLLWSNHDRHPEEKMVLFGRRLVTASELPEGRRLNEALVKQITGSQMLSARELYSKRIEFSRTWVPTLDTNHMPRINGTEDAVWDRVLKIVFGQVFRGTEREEKGLSDRLKEHPDDVLSWCASGWRDYQSVGLGVPAEVRQSTAAYRAAQDKVGQFLSDNQDAGITCEPSAVAFKRFREEYGAPAWMTTRKFNADLRERGVAIRQGTGNITMNDYETAEPPH